MSYLFWIELRHCFPNYPHSKQDLWFLCQQSVIRGLKWNHKIQTPPQVLFNFLTTSKKLGYQVMLRNAIWKLGIAEIAKAYRHIGKVPGPTAAKINVLAHVGLWPMIIKLNPSWKMGVSQSTWISPCYCLWIMKFLYVFILK